MQRTHTGFTILELLVTIAIVAILASLAVPSYNQLITNNRQTAAINSFVGALTTARSEAVKRGRQVAICPSAGTDCDANLNWDAGWLVFIDNDRDQVIDAGEELVTVGEPLELGFSLVGDSDTADSIRFLGDGTSLESGTITLCDSRGAGNAKSVIISSTGRAKTATENAAGGVLLCP